MTSEYFVSGIRRDDQSRTYSLNLQTGNPYLKPVKYHNLNAMIMWKWIYLTTNFSHCVDPILYTAESVENDSKINFVTYKNYDHADWLTVTLGAQKNVKRNDYFLVCHYVLRVR